MKPLIIWQICLLVSVSQAANAQDSSPNKNGVPPVSRTPKRVHRPVQRQALTHTPTATPTAKSTRNNRLSYAEAVRRYRHERHDRAWWKQHFTTIVLVGGGYYYWDAGYWCPAWGYNTAYQYYDYDGPIYTYGNLLPDQVIINVQRALQQLGYYSGGLTGALSSATRGAIAVYQQDAGLDVTGVVDAPTVESLGLN